MGGTPYYVTAVWWGYDAPYDMTKTLSKQQAKTRTCVMAWKALMEQAQADLPYKAFPTSAGVVERRYCTQSGLLAGAGCPSTAVGTTVPMTCPIPAPIPMPHRRLLPRPRTQTMLCPPSRSSPPIPVHWTRNKDKNRTFQPFAEKSGKDRAHFTRQNWTK